MADGLEALGYTRTEVLSALYESGGDRAGAVTILNGIADADARSGKKDHAIEHTSGADLKVGVSWDFMEGAPKVDLDCSAVIFDETGTVMDAAYYNQLSAMTGLVKHSGDNRTGAGDGPDEEIHLDLDGLPVNVKVIIFTVTCHSGGSLKDVESAFAEFTDVREGGADFVAGEISIGAAGFKNNNTALILGGIYRSSDDGKWYIRKLSCATMGFTFADCLDTIRHW